MSAHRRSPYLPGGARVVTLASSPSPEGVTSNIGHPSEPAVVGVYVGGDEPVVTISEGSGHLGGGGAFWLEDVLTEAGGLQGRWEPVFARAGALWLVPLLGRLATGERVGEERLVELYRERHGAEPEVRVIWRPVS